MLKLPKVINAEYTILLTIITLCVGTLSFAHIEGWTYIDSLYFSVITLTTVGYGDFSPQTAFGRLFTIFYVFVGIGIVLTLVNLIAKKEVENQLEKKLELRYKHNLEREMREIHKKK